MSILTGKHGAVLANDIALAEITLWTFKTTRKHVAYCSSATAGFRRRLPSVREGSGRFHFVLNTAQPASAGLHDNAAVTLTLAIDRDHQYVVPAVIDVVQIETDINGGGPVTGWAEFSTTGPWSEPQ
jgi:hypothetical protein